MADVVLNTGDTAWVLASTALVLLMTPGLALFYGGMVRAKSVLNMMLMSMITIGIVSVLWVIYGFKLAFGYKDNSQWYGEFSLSGLGSAVNELTNNGGVYPIPLLAFAAFQLMFAIITPALISGAIADRTKFTAWAVFVTFWSTLVYFPVAHWVFAFGNKVGDTVTGAGFLAARGVEDFAGGTAVHINAGAAGLALAIVLGRRIGWRKESMRPHSMPLVLVGAGLLWFGWFGFNAGSALEANGSAALAFVTTLFATAAAVLGWTLGEWVTKGKPSMLGAASGCVAGLVAITPAAGFVGPMGAIIIGFVAGLLCLWGVSGLKRMLGADDSLDVFGVHGIGGITGALLTGVFADPALGGAGIYDYVANAVAKEYSIASQVIIQAQGVVVTLIWSGIVAFIAFKIADLVFGLRVKEEAEREGLDITSHGESAYES